MSKDGQFDPRSLEEIEGDVWGDPPPDSSDLVETIHELRRVPIGLLGADGLVDLLEQKVGTETVVPIALNFLEEDPLVDGIYYAGDLLSAVLRLPMEYWNDHPDQLARLRGVVDAVVAMGEETWSELVPSLARRIEEFRAGRSA